MQRKKKIAFYANHYGAVASPHGMRADTLMSHTGHNIGNLAFIRAGRMMFGDDADISLFNELSAQERKNLDCLVIPAANFLGNHSNLNAMVDVLDNTTCPCLIFGLGAQSEYTDIVPDMKPATIDLRPKCRGLCAGLGLAVASSSRAKPDIPTGRG